MTCSCIDWQVSVSYKGRKGAVPDIDSLVVNIPTVLFSSSVFGVRAQDLWCMVSYKR